MVYTSTHRWLRSRYVEPRGYLCALSRSWGWKVTALLITALGFSRYQSCEAIESGIRTAHRAKETHVTSQFHGRCLVVQLYSEVRIGFGYA